MNSLFRKEVFETKTSNYVGHVVISTPIGYKVLISIFAFFAIIVLCFVFLGTFTKKVRVMGQVLPKSGLVRIYSTQLGQIENIYIKENMKVNKGDNLLEIASPLYSKEMNIRNSLLEESKNRKLMLIGEIQKLKLINMENINRLKNEEEGLQKEINNTNFVISNILLKMKIAKNNYERYLLLYKQSAVSLEELEVRENTYIDLDNQVKVLNNDLMKLNQDLIKKNIEVMSIQKQQENNISSLERDLSIINQENIQNQLNSSQVIKSPIDGTVSIINIEKGQNVELNKSLVSIVPKDEELICLLYVPSNAIGFVKIGSEVSVRYQAYPYQKFGIAKAKVTNISISPIPSSELNTLGIIPAQNIANNEPIYIIKALLNKQTITVYGKEVVLKSGMLLDADIRLETRKIYEWALEPLYTISGTL